MSTFKGRAKSFYNADTMAAAYLREYFPDAKIEYPINPFQMLKDEGIVFSFRPFGKLEGVYIPASQMDDVPLVGINLKRPITRQRFTAAHELCHHFRDSESQVVCPIGDRSPSERFADDFAAAILMPIGELRRLVNERKVNGYVPFEAVLEIADYFGVSFQACLFRIAYRLHAISGATDPGSLNRRITKFAPDKKRRERGMSSRILYEGLIDSFAQNLSFTPSDFAKNVFQNNYIYNDSRMEGLDISLEAASEIVTDLYHKKQASKYCQEKNEAFLSIAGHYQMYEAILESPIKDRCSVFDTFSLNKDLFSCFPFPEYGGQVRKTDTLVMGAQFDTVDPNQIYPELIKIDGEIKQHFSEVVQMPLSKYLERVFEFHHRLTVIHPFADGNGRTLRAFMNVMLVRSRICPLYIKCEEKDAYFHALEIADLTGNYDELYEVLFKALLRSHSELCE